MKKSVFIIFNLFAVLLIIMISGCDQNTSVEKDDGKIQVSLVNAGAVADGTDCFISIFHDGDNMSSDKEIEIMRTTVKDGATTVTSSYNFPDDKNYDVLIVIDNNNTADDDNPHPDGGDKYNNSAYNVKINGRTKLKIDYNDLITY
jgi:hypothetical protein